MKYLLLLACVCACLFACTRTEYVYRDKIITKCVSFDVKEVNTLNFEQEVQNAKEDMVMVEFFAPWCEPCRMEAPIVREISEETCGKYKVVKVDVDKDLVIATTHKVEVIPTVIVFHNGFEHKRLTGLSSKQDLMGLFQ